MDLQRIDYFQKLDIRVGRVLEIEDFPEAKKLAFRLKIDFGKIGIQQSSVQITENYSKEELKARLVLAVVNFPPRRIGPFGQTGISCPRSFCAIVFFIFRIFLKYSIRISVQ